jgi:hypothetical protein
MPFVPRAPEYKGPKGPHLALLTGEGWIGIPEGATLWLVEDGSNPNKIFPLTLKQIRGNRLTFVMPDKDGNLSEYQYRLMSGKPLSKAGLERMLANRKGRAGPTVPGAPTPKTDGPAIL